MALAVHRPIADDQLEAREQMLRDAEIRDLETDFFRRGDELSESSIEPVDDFADLDQDSGSRTPASARWTRPSLVVAVGALVLLITGGFLVAQGDTAPDVDDRMLSRLAVEASVSARPPLTLVVDLGEPDPPASDPVVPPPPAIATPTGERLVIAATSGLAASEPAPARARARAHQPRRNVATRNVAVARRAPADADARGVARVVSSRPRSTAQTPSKQARRLRAIGHHYRKRGLRRSAAQAYRHYLRLAPGASDAPELRRLVSQLGG